MATYKAMDVFLAQASAGAMSKIGELTANRWEFMSNSEQVITADEAAETIGVVTSSMTLETFIPVGGTGLGLTDLQTGQIDIVLSGLIDGKLRRVKGRFIKSSGQSTIRTGTHTGSWDFRGGAPESMGI